VKQVDQASLVDAVAASAPSDRRNRDGFYFGTTSPYWHGTLRRIFASIEAAGVEYCILHGYSGYDGVESGDIDCIVDPKDLPHRFGAALSDAAAGEGCRLINWYPRAQQAHVFVLGRQCDAGLDVFWLDVAYADYEGNWVYYEASELLSRRQQVNGFRATAPAIEFAAYLAIKVTKHMLTPAHGDRLSALYRQDPAGARKELLRFFSAGPAALIAAAAEHHDWRYVRENFDALHAEVLRAGRRRALRIPLRTMSYFASEAVRRPLRLLRRTGFHLRLDGELAALDVDAARLLAPAFRRVELVGPATHSPLARLRARIARHLGLARTTLIVSTSGLPGAGRPDLACSGETGAGLAVVCAAVLEKMEVRTRRALRL
jgi:hypothetical protein